MARKTGKRRKGASSSAASGGWLSRKTKAVLAIVGLLVCAFATSQRYLRRIDPPAGQLAPTLSSEKAAAANLRGGSDSSRGEVYEIRSRKAVPPAAAPALGEPVVAAQSRSGGSLSAGVDEVVSQKVEEPIVALQPVVALQSRSGSEKPSSLAEAIAESERFNKDCRYMAGNPQSSRPGRPCVPGAAVWPWATKTEWRTHFGERILAAVSPKVTEEQCEGFELFGDQTWCQKGFGPEGTLGLSYGIEERDLWSETFSSQYGVATWLFDCFIPLDRSPPMAGTTGNGTGKGSCKGRRDQPKAHCYEEPYRPVRACLAAEEGLIQGRRYEPLESHLRGRGPLSTYLKIDVEGSEWTVLERLLASKEDCDKIRTLDMEVHFDFKSDSEAKATKGMNDRAILEREVSIMEGLLKHFEVTGSTLEVYRQGWTPDRDCPTQECKEPPLHTAGGFSVRQFAVSYVNRKLM